MSQRGPWSVKGIDSRAREVAREAAREEGMTLGAYLNRLILDDGSEIPGGPTAEPQAPRAAAPNSTHAEPAPSASNTTLDRLTRRIESAEARSTLAITGIDQSVVGLLSRLENAEHNQQAMGSHLEGVMDDIQKTYDTLTIKVRSLEEDDSAASNLTALKSLEDALGKLASYVYEENELVGEETNAIKTRLETGLGDISERMDAVDNTIQSKIEDTTEAFLKTVAEAELRTEGISKHLAERFTTVELEVSEKLSHVQEMSLSMDQVHDNVEGSLSNMTDTLGHMQERLSRAETLTDKAMHELETRFSALDTRLEEVRKFANEETDSKFEQRFEALTNDLRELVTSTRVELAGEIEAAAKSVDADVLDRIDGAIGSIGARLDSSEDLQTQTMDMVGETVSRVTESVDQRLTANQNQQARAIEQVSKQVSRISEGLDQRISAVEATDPKAETNALREEMIRFTNTLDDRLEYLETREDETFEKISTEVEKLADQLDKRVEDSETRSANAIEQVGEQVAGVANRIEKRQNAALKAFADKLDDSQKRQDARLTGALSSVSERLERMQEQSITSMSPVQKAIAALAQRMEAIEDFSAPPYIDRDNDTAIPDMVAPMKIDTDLTHLGAAAAASLTTSAVSTDTPEQTPDEHVSAGEGFLDPIFEDNSTIENDATPPETDEAFEPGYENWANDANAVLDDTLNTAKELAPEVEDDLIIHDGRDEARDNDIFGDDALPPPPTVEELVQDEFEAAAATPADNEISDAERELPGDYISQARLAARTAADAKPKSALSKASSGSRMTTSTKILGVAAIAATAAVVGGVLYNRGDTKAPSLEFGSDTDVQATAASTGGDAGAGTAALASLAVDAEEDGFNADVDVDAAGTDLVESAETLAATNVEEPQLVPDPVEVAATIPKVDRNILLATPPITKRVSLSQAAQDGNRVAQYELGLQSLRNGRFADGAEWLQKASQQGFPAAQYELGILHENGTAVARDATQARYWYKAAARGGSVEAMFDFASYNANGQGGEANMQVAAEWFRKAAEFGHTDSQYNLARLYSQGTGISPSYADALFWYGLAAAGGDQDARQSAADILAEGHVSDPAARAVRQRMDEWRRATPNPIANGKFGAQPWGAGNGGNQVLATQRVLAALGYGLGIPDGVMGNQTREAIKAFERSAGMPQTGRITDRLIDVLNASLKEEQRAA